MDLHLSKPESVRILLLEDDEHWATLVRVMLDDAWNVDFDVSHVGSLADARSALAESAPDCMVVDLTLPDADWLEAPVTLHAVAPDVPLVVLSALEDESLAVRAVHEGAQDYLVKGHATPHLIERAILYAIERKRAEAEYTAEARYDPVTGLPNRNVFLERLHHALDSRNQRHPAVVVFFVSVGELRLISDSLGQPVGKKLLHDIGMRLRAAVPELACVACFGAGIYALWREGIAGGPYRGRTIDHLVRSFESPFAIDADVVFVTPQIGIAISEAGSDDSPEELIRQAEVSVSDEARRTAYVPSPS
jgi:diguanylate cyclase